MGSNGYHGSLFKNVCARDIIPESFKPLRDILIFDPFWFSISRVASRDGNGQGPSSTKERLLPFFVLGFVLP